MTDLIGIPTRAARARAWLARNGSALVIAAAFATVVGGTGFVSYTHICALLLQAHQSWKTAHVIPLAIDGQIIIGSVIFMVLRRWWCLLGLIGIIPGILESLYANWESGAVYGFRDAAIAAVASQVFAGSSFMFERWLKAQGGRHMAHVRLVTVGCGHGVAEDRDGRILDAWNHIKHCLAGEPSYRGIGSMLGVHNEIVRQVVTSVADDGGEAPERGRDSTTPAVPAAPEPAAGASQGHALAASNGSGVHA